MPEIKKKKKKKKKKKIVFIMWLFNLTNAVTF